MECLLCFHCSPSVHVIWLTSLFGMLRILVAEHTSSSFNGHVIILMLLEVWALLVSNEELKKIQKGNSKTKDLLKGKGKENAHPTEGKAAGARAPHFRSKSFWLHRKGRRSPDVWTMLTDADDWHLQDLLCVPFRNHFPILSETIICMRQFMCISPQSVAERGLWCPKGHRKEPPLDVLVHWSSSCWVSLPNNGWFFLSSIEGSYGPNGTLQGWSANG